MKHIRIFLVLVFMVLLPSILIYRDIPDDVSNPRMDPQDYHFNFQVNEGASCQLQDFYIDIDVDKKSTNMSFDIRCDKKTPSTDPYYVIMVPSSLILDEYSWIDKDGNELKEPHNFTLERIEEESNKWNDYKFDFPTKVKGDVNLVFSGEIIPNGRFSISLREFKIINSQGSEIEGSHWFNDRVGVRLGKNYKLIDARPLNNNVEMFTLTFEDGERVYAIDRSSPFSYFAISSYNAVKLRQQTALTWFLFTWLGAGLFEFARLLGLRRKIEEIIEKILGKIKGRW